MNLLQKIINFFKKKKNERMKGILIKTDIKLFEEEYFFNVSSLMCVAFYDPKLVELTFFEYTELNKEFGKTLVNLIERDIHKNGYLYVYKYLTEERVVYVFLHNSDNKYYFGDEEQRFRFYNAMDKIKIIEREKKLKTLLD